jgi:hypothetical protein
MTDVYPIPKLPPSRCAKYKLAGEPNHWPDFATQQEINNREINRENDQSNNNAPYTIPPARAVEPFLYALSAAVSVAVRGGIYRKRRPHETAVKIGVAQAVRPRKVPLFYKRFTNLSA